jgi:hypothetical protein
MDWIDLAQLHGVSLFNNTDSPYCIALNDTVLESCNQPGMTEDATHTTRSTVVST